MSNWIIGERVALKYDDIERIELGCQGAESNLWHIKAYMKDGTTETLRYGAFQECKDYLNNLNGTVAEAKNAD